MTDENRIDEWLEYARVLVERGRVAEAKQALQKVADAVPANLKVRAQLIELARQMGDATTLVYQYMDCAELHSMSGNILGAWEQYEHILRLEAAEVRDLVAAVKPEIYLRFGEFSLAQGHPQKALMYLRKSYELKPGVWETNQALGRTYFELGQDKAAIREFQEVLRLCQSIEGWAGAAEANRWLGEIFVRQGAPRSTTVVWFERAADHYSKLNQSEEMANMRKRILELQPEQAAPDHECYRLRARGDFAGALAEVDRLLQDRPDDVQALLLRGECLRVLERHEEALENDRRLSR